MTTNLGVFKSTQVSLTMVRWLLSCLRMRLVRGFLDLPLILPAMLAWPKLYLFVASTSLNNNVLYYDHLYTTVNLFEVLNLCLKTNEQSNYYVLTMMTKNTNG